MRKQPSKLKLDFCFQRFSFWEVLALVMMPNSNTAALARVPSATGTLEHCGIVATPGPCIGPDGRISHGGTIDEKCDPMACPHDHTCDFVQMLPFTSYCSPQSIPPTPPTPKQPSVPTEIDSAHEPEIDSQHELDVRVSNACNDLTYYQPTTCSTKSTHKAPPPIPISTHSSAHTEIDSQHELDVRVSTYSSTSD